MRRPANTELSTAEIPATWYGGTLTSWASSSPAPMNSTVVRMYEVRWRWRSTAAFGSPVVPLVNSRMAMSSGSAGGELDVAGGLGERRPGSSSVVDHLDAVDAADALAMSASTTASAGANRREDAAQLLVVEAVVDRCERDAGERRAEQQQRARRRS